MERYNFQKIEKKWRENKNAISNFKEFYRKESDIYNLELWHQYEKREPLSFAGMYEFWCQKL